MLAACSKNVARFDEPTSFRFNERSAASGGPSGHWNSNAPEPVSYSDNYEYRGGRNPASGRAPPPRLQPAANHEAGYGSRQPYGDQAAHDGGYDAGQGSAQRDIYDGGPVEAYADWQTPRRGSGYPASGNHDDGQARASDAGMIVDPIARNDYPPPRSY